MNGKTFPIAATYALVRSIFSAEIMRAILSTAGEYFPDRNKIIALSIHTY